MSKEKKLKRKKFRDVCFARDKYACVMCSFRSSPDKCEEELDCHHISDRHLFPNGGYVKANGISLCDQCHIKAEIFHSTGEALEGFHPNDLYKKIGSTFEKALEEDKRNS